MRTNLLSPRRAPTQLAIEAAALQSAAQNADLTAELTDMIGPGACVSLRRDETVIAEEAATDGLVPASNMKVLVASAALDVLGADHRFPTELRSVAPVGGVIAGDLYVTGGGDPVLTTAGHVDPLPHPAVNTTALDPLVDQLVAAGITRIDGDVVGDASRYDDEFTVPSWGDDITNADAGPYDALLVNDGLLANGDYGLVPAQSAANIVDDLIRARGITVGGSSRHAPPPPDLELTTLARIESEPLTEILVELLHTSDNNTAEMLLKEIGFATSGEGTRGAGIAAIGARLAAWGISDPAVVIDDGSGLSRVNRATCDALSRLFGATPEADELLAAMPVAGRDGTLADEFVGTPAEGEMVAKTGTLTGVKALSGVMDGADDDPVEFSLILNGEGVDDPAVYQPYWHTLADVIARYPIVVAPDAEQFAPR
jgi:D-alanyl-D-alanine carboxypeptidase/D-alanyl-D-alanine-endopeptidase (penicillin-binding protein 4)